MRVVADTEAGVEQQIGWAPFLRHSALRALEEVLGARLVRIGVVSVGLAIARERGDQLSGSGWLVVLVTALAFGNQILPLALFGLGIVDCALSAWSLGALAIAAGVEQVLALACSVISVGFASAREQGSWSLSSFASSNSATSDVDGVEAAVVGWVVTLLQSGTGHQESHSISALPEVVFAGTHRIVAGLFPIAVELLGHIRLHGCALDGGCRRGRSQFLNASECQRLRWVRADSRVAAFESKAQSTGGRTGEGVFAGRHVTALQRHWSRIATSDRLLEAVEHDDVCLLGTGPL